MQLLSASIHFLALRAKTQQGQEPAGGGREEGREGAGQGPDLYMNMGSLDGMALEASTCMQATCTITMFLLF